MRSICEDDVLEEKNTVKTLAVDLQRLTSAVVTDINEHKIAIKTLDARLQEVVKNTERLTANVTTLTNMVQEKDAVNKEHRTVLGSVIKAVQELASTIKAVAIEQKAAGDDLEKQAAII